MELSLFYCRQFDGHIQTIAAVNERARVHKAGDSQVAKQRKLMVLLERVCFLSFIRARAHNEKMLAFFSLLLNGGPSAQPDVLEFCKDLLAKSVRSPHLHCFLLDHHMELLEKTIDASSNAEHSREHLRTLVDLDPIRVNYYKYLRARVDKLSVGA